MLVGSFEVKTLLNPPGDVVDGGDCKLANCVPLDLEALGPVGDGVDGVLVVGVLVVVGVVAGAGGGVGPAVPPCDVAVPSPIKIPPDKMNGSGSIKPSSLAGPEWYGPVPTSKCM